MISGAYKPVIMQAIFGSSRGSKIPKTLHMTFNNTQDVPLSSSRVAVPNDDTMWAPYEYGVVNQTPITATASAAWIIGSVSFWTAATGGVLMCTIPLEEPLTVDAGSDLSFPAGNLMIDAE